jgi:hypothetical protein
MNTNKLKYCTWIGIGFVLIFGTLAHFIYEWTGNNFIVGLFAPVNESTWEHMKLVFFPMIIYAAFMEKLLFIDYPRILPSLCIGLLSGTLLVAILYYTYSGILGFNVFILDLAVFIISVFAAFWISYRLAISNKYANLIRFQALFLVLVGVMAMCFMVYTINPPNLQIFREH